MSYHFGTACQRIGLVVGVLTSFRGTTTWEVSNGNVASLSIWRDGGLYALAGVLRAVASSPLIFWVAVTTNGLQARLGKRSTRWW